ncbi:hypothetical protein AYO38_07695 [bacterium SCGC AG-212-C10]|nr:hypothetical protein AYO38_07695 [bacterium SCGC AG-212-C10]
MVTDSSLCISTHPGEILLLDFLEPMGLPAEQLAAHLWVSEIRLRDVIAGVARVDGELAWKLGMALGTTPEFWMNLQSNYER